MVQRRPRPAILPNSTDPLKLLQDRGGKKMMTTRTRRSGTRPMAIHLTGWRTRRSSLTSWGQCCGAAPPPVAMSLTTWSLSTTAPSSPGLPSTCERWMDKRLQEEWEGLELVSFFHRFLFMGPLWLDSVGGGSPPLRKVRQLQETSFGERVGWGALQGELGWGGRCPEKREVQDQGCSSPRRIPCFGCRERF